MGTDGVDQRANAFVMTVLVAILVLLAPKRMGLQDVLRPAPLKKHAAVRVGVCRTGHAIAFPPSIVAGCITMCWNRSRIQLLSTRTLAEAAATSALPELFVTTLSSGEMSRERLSTVFANTEGSKNNAFRAALAKGCRNVKKACMNVSRHLGKKGLVSALVGFERAQWMSNANS